MTDTAHSGSRRHDVWEELKAQTTEKISKASEDFANLRKDMDRLDHYLKTQFTRYESIKATLEEGGIVAQMKFTPILDAAHGAWLRDRDVPRRLELSEVSEAPIPPEDAA